MILIVGVVLLISAAAHACNTPVYRYAMYNWPPAPFFVFYFHQGEPAKEDEEVNGLIRELVQKGPAVANIVFEPVDASQPLDHIPEPVKKVWQEHSKTGGDHPKPAHLVFTSWGVKLFAGRLDKATLLAMVDSPARTRIGKLFDEGCGTVMVLVPGSEAAENERAEKVAREVIDGVASGSIVVDPAYGDSGYSERMPDSETPGDAPSDGDAPSEDEPARQANRLQVKLVKVARSDAAEKWFVAPLMKMEPDLEELAEQPMIFCLYGRGRAMWPYVGKGITADNLTELLQFLAGPCSCMVKEQNPGLDLLMRWDWDSTADAMAANDETLYGAPFAYQEYSADDAGNLVPSESPQAEVEAASTVAGPQAEMDAAASPEAAPSPASGPPPTSDQEVTTKPEPQKPSEALALAKRRENVGVSAGERPERNEDRSFVSRQMWMLGIGFVVAMAVVLGIGLVLARKQATNGGRWRP